MCNIIVLYVQQIVILIYDCFVPINTVLQTHSAVNIHTHNLCIPQYLIKWVEWDLFLPLLKTLCLWNGADLRVMLLFCTLRSGLADLVILGRDLLEPQQGWWLYRGARYLQLHMVYKWGLCQQLEQDCTAEKRYYKVNVTTYTCVYLHFICAQTRNHTHTTNKWLYKFHFGSCSVCVCGIV